MFPVNECATPSHYLCLEEFLWDVAMFLYPNLSYLAFCRFLYVHLK